MHSYMYTVVNNKRKNTEFRGIVLVEVSVSLSSYGDSTDREGRR